MTEQESQRDRGNVYRGAKIGRFREPDYPFTERRGDGDLTRRQWNLFNPVLGGLGPPCGIHARNRYVVASGGEKGDRWGILEETYLVIQD